MIDGARLGPTVSRGFWQILGILFAIGLLALGASLWMSSAVFWVKHTYQVRESLETIESDLGLMESTQRAYLITGKEAFLEPYSRFKSEISSQLNALGKLIHDNPVQVDRLNALRKHIEDRIALTDHGVVLKRSGNTAAVIAHINAGTGQRAMDAARSRLKEMKAEEDRLLSDRNSLTTRAERSLVGVIIGGCLLSLALGMRTLRSIRHHVVQPVHQITNGLASSAMEIATTVEEQERIASQQSASVNETTTTMDELGTSLRATSSQADVAAGESRQSLTLVDEGNVAVEQTYAGMLSLKEKVDGIANQILRLSEQTSQIGTVTTLVSDLASQTNMLALNAAVEAARAGEHGKGFNIVATEIRKLADESKRSAERIHALVADIQKATNSTVMATEEGTKTVDRSLQLAQSTGVTFNGLATSVRNSYQSVQQITLNVKQQASAVGQVVEAMNALNGAARETATGMAQTRVTVDLLNDSAQRLKSIV